MARRLLDDVLYHHDMPASKTLLDFLLQIPLTEAFRTGFTHGDAGRSVSYPCCGNRDETNQFQTFPSRENVRCQKDPLQDRAAVPHRPGETGISHLRSASPHIAAGLHSIGTPTSLPLVGPLILPRRPARLGLSVSGPQIVVESSVSSTASLKLPTNAEGFMVMQSSEGNDTLSVILGIRASFWIFLMDLDASLKRCIVQCCKYASVMLGHHPEVWKISLAF